MIQAKIIADSMNEFGNRITTMVVTMPRFILAEFNTHRMFSRNSASSRAIPFEKMVKSVQENPFIPIAWQKDHKGMQGIEYLNKEESKKAETIWLYALQDAIQKAKGLNTGKWNLNQNGFEDVYTYEISVTKQLCNRLLEPFMWHTVIITATEFSNFFALRCPLYETPYGDFRSKKDCIKADEFNFVDVATFNPTEKNSLYFENYTDLQWLEINKGQAEIHMMALAEAMWDALNESTPKQLQANEWHIPYEEKICEDYGINNPQTDIDIKDNIPWAVKIGTVLAARTSYTLVGTEMSTWSIDKIAAKCDDLSEANPIHASPFEHCAKAMNTDEYNNSGIYVFSHRENNVLAQAKSEASIGWSGNFRGFIQYRKMFNNENHTL